MAKRQSELDAQRVAFLHAAESKLQEANSLHLQVKDAFEPFLELAKKTGAALHEACEQVRQAGNKWETWLERMRLENKLKFGTRTAQGYLRIHDNWMRIEELRKRKPGLSLRQALYAISKPRKGAKASRRNRLHVQRIARKIIAPVVSKWDKAELRWLHENYSKEVVLRLDCEKILKEAFALVRGYVRDAMSVEAKPGE